MSHQNHTKTVLHIAPTPFFSDRGCHIRICNEIKALIDCGMQVILCTYPLGDDVPGLEMDDSDPLTTKLTLAQEFLAIGDKEGARSLAQEVLSESTSPTVKAQAQRLIDQSR